KYSELQDSYKSILESFIHAGAVCDVKVSIKSFHSESIDDETNAKKKSYLDGILVSLCFGGIGVYGKIKDIRYERENNVPFLGICLGMQLAVNEFARNVLNLNEADSTEMNPKTTDPIIDFMDHQKIGSLKHDNMRLGAWDIELTQDSLIH